MKQSYEAMFPEPRQVKLDEMALIDEQIQNIQVPALLFHGLNDLIIPIEKTSYRLIELLPHVELHVFNESGYWIQIEKTKPFVEDILTIIK